MAYYFFTMPSVDTWVNRYLYNSMHAAGNIILPDSKFSDNSMMIAGMVAHVALSLTWGVALSYATRRVDDPAYIVMSCVALAFTIHYFDLLVVPKFWSMPKMSEFINETGLMSHLFDHLSFGATTGAVLAGLRTGKFREWYDRYWVEQRSEKSD